MNRVILPLMLLIVAASFTTPAFASQTFGASVTCKGPTFGVIGGSFAYWNWTANGVAIGPFVQTGIFASSGVLHCNSTGGGPNTTSTTGSQPPNANGILVRLTSQIKGCYHTFITTQAFTAGEPVSVSLSASCTAVSYHVVITETATFALKS